MQLLRCPNRLSIESVDVTHCLAIRIFISHLGSSPLLDLIPSAESGSSSGLLGFGRAFGILKAIFSVVRMIWKDVMLKFGLEWDIRFIIHGHNANFERPIS